MAVYTIELDRLLQSTDFDSGLFDYPVPSFLTTPEEQNAWREALNKKIISFKEIPSELSEAILEKVNTARYTNEPVNNATIDLRDFMTL